MRSLIFISILTCSPAFADESKTEWITEEIWGVPKAIEIESKSNWRAACRDFARSKPEGSYILEVDCGEVRCVDNQYEITCTSHGRKLIKFDEPKK